jgi:hypothetical protein
MLASIIASAQEDTSFLDFSAYVRLDSIMITAKQEGFSVEEFIKVIQNDNSLEESFNNLRQLSYTYTNDIKFYDQKDKIKASYKSKNKQSYNGECQWMEVLKEEVKGNYFKRSGKYNYYTSNLYDRVFYQSRLDCGARLQNTETSRARKILENRINELKKLIYTPGKEVDVPLIGKKTTIFSEQMFEHYDFSLKSKKDPNGDYIYLFTASIKPHFNFQDPDGSVVKFLEIEMMAGSYQVLSRKYKLQYNAGIYDFDILMLIELSRHENEYIPSDIKYDGYWKIIGKKRENCKFNFKIIEFL